MRRVVIVGSLVLGSLAGSSACSSPVPREPPSQETVDLPVTINPNLDLLFLIDDSPRSKDKQSNVADGLPAFLESLSSIPGFPGLPSGPVALPNVHIGVVTSDMGTQDVTGKQADPIPPLGRGGCADVGKNGNLQTFTAPITGDPFLSDIADQGGNRIRNFSGALSDVLSVMVRGTGAGGCGFEQHLAAVIRALDPAHPANRGFVRPDAHLGVIIVADEDDCSLADSVLLSTTPTLGPLQSFRCTRYGVRCDEGGQTADTMNLSGVKGRCHPDDSSAYLTPAPRYVDALNRLKSDSSSVFVAALVGPTDPFEVGLRVPSGGQVPIPAVLHSCVYTGGDSDGDGVPDPEVADPAVRITSVVDQFGERGAISNICQKDLSDGLQRFAGLAKHAIVGDPCFAHPLAAGDVDCKASMIWHKGGPDQTEMALPRCVPEHATATNPPCWRLDLDAVSCPAAEHRMVKIEGLASLRVGARVYTTCTLAPPNDTAIPNDAM